MNPIKTIWVWVCRFRKRKGYGVHSPSAYHLIRFVINEKDSYYTYQDLKGQRKKCKVLPEKVDKLLFRLANYMQPQTLIQVGDEYPLSLKYMASGCAKATTNLLKADEPFEEKIKAALNGKGLDLLCLLNHKNISQWFEAALPYTTENTLAVILGIHDSPDKWAWWKEIQGREEIGITFDLYELGLIFFDRSKIKQHYKVNFV